MLDSNAFDALALDDAARVRVETAVKNGTLVLVVTHIQIDELNRTPDNERRLALQRLTVQGTYTAGFVVGVSRLDMGTIPSDDEVAIYNAVTGGNAAHAEDALILLTARRDGIPVVTDERRLPKQCAKYGVEAMKTEALLDRLR
jgi:hypothetical protein